MHERRCQEKPWRGRERWTTGNSARGWIVLQREAERDQPAEAAGWPRTPSPL